MIRGLGIDVVDVARLAASLERTPALRERLFPEADPALDVESLAARLAAKEALVKSLGDSRGLAPADVEIVSDESGRPSLRLRGAAAQRVGDGRVHLSLTHDAGVAAAVVVLEEEPPRG